MGIKTALISTVGKVTFWGREHSPELLLAMGGLSMIGSVITACRGTLKFQKVIEKHNERLDKLKLVAEKQANGTAEENTDIDVKQYRKSVYLDTIWQGAKCYGPTVLLMIGGFACFMASNGIIKGRYISMAAAYAGVLTDKEHLEEQIIKEMGEEKLAELKGEKPSSDIFKSEDGEVKAVEGEKVTYSTYAKFFDESNPNWEKNPESNRTFLQIKQNWANHRLQTRGYLFLNEVYEMLEMEKTQAGQIMGWVYYKDPAKAKEMGSANFVDFGIFNKDSVAARNFVNGTERSILLDFNVDAKPVLGRAGLASA